MLVRSFHFLHIHDAHFAKGVDQSIDGGYVHIGVVGMGCCGGRVEIELFLDDLLFVHTENVVGKELSFYVQNEAENGRVKSAVLDPAV